MLDIRNFSKEDYDVFNDWLVEYGWRDGIPYNVLPPLGLVVYDPASYSPQAIGFLYHIKGCEMYMMDFVAADPKLQATAKMRATQLVIEKIIELAKKLSNGNGWIYSVSSNKAYIRIAESKGFQIAEKEVSSLFYPLNDNPDRVGFLCEDKE